MPRGVGKDDPRNLCCIATSNHPLGPGPARSGGDYHNDMIEDALDRVCLPRGKRKWDPDCIRDRQISLKISLACCPMSLCGKK